MPERCDSSGCKEPPWTVKVRTDDGTKLKGKSKYCSKHACRNYLEGVGFETNSQPSTSGAIAVCQNKARRDYEYCADHKCKASKCTSEKACGADWCADHMCYDPNCPGVSGDGEKYCSEHACSEKGCLDPKVSPRWCLGHTPCDFPNCFKGRVIVQPNGQRRVSFYCTMHDSRVCKTNSCQSKLTAPTNQSHCDSHACRIRGCDGEKSLNGDGTKYSDYCFMHNCAQEDCHMPVMHLGGPSSHRHQRQEHQEDVAKFCEQHECTKPGCRADRAVDKPFCGDHCCTLAGCLKERSSDRTIGPRCAEHIHRIVEMEERERQQQQAQQAAAARAERERAEAATRRRHLAEQAAKDREIAELKERLRLAEEEKPLPSNHSSASSPSPPPPPHMRTGGGGGGGAGNGGHGQYFHGRDWNAMPTPSEPSSTSYARGGGGGEDDSAWRTFPAAGRGGAAAGVSPTTASHADAGPSFGSRRGHMRYDSGVGGVGAGFRTSGEFHQKNPFVEDQENEDPDLWHSQYRHTGAAPHWQTSGTRRFG